MGNHVFGSLLLGLLNSSIAHLKSSGIKGYLAHLRYPSSKNEKTHKFKNSLVFSHENIFLDFGKWKFLSPKLKNSYTFLKIVFLYFRGEFAKPEKQKALIFLGMELCSLRGGLGTF